jgi:hypothetical protein
VQHPHRRRLLAQPGVGTQVSKQSRKSKRSLTGLIEAEPEAKDERTVMDPRLPKQSQKSKQSQKRLFEAGPEVEARERTKVVGAID